MSFFNFSVAITRTSIEVFSPRGLVFVLESEYNVTKAHLMITKIIFKEITRKNHGKI